MGIALVALDTQKPDNALGDGEIRGMSAQSLPAGQMPGHKTG
jgi:hypothetical protein